MNLIVRKIIIILSKRMNTVRVVAVLFIAVVALNGCSQEDLTEPNKTEHVSESKAEKPEESKAEKAEESKAEKAEENKAEESKAEKPEENENKIEISMEDAISIAAEEAVKYYDNLKLSEVHKFETNK